VPDTIRLSYREGSIVSIVRAPDLSATVRPEAGREVFFARPGQPLPAGARWVAYENGGEASVATRPPATAPRLPRDAAYGYHSLSFDDGRQVPLIVSPGTCYLPAGPRTWGWAVQPYALRSGRTWGIGDVSAVRRVARWSAGQGAGVLLSGPIHASLPVLPQQPSPYYPSSRRFANPLYLDVEAAPGAAAGDSVVVAARAQGRRLDQAQVIDRDAVFGNKMRALEQLWAGFRAGTGGQHSFRRYCTEQGDTLSDFGTFNALAERFGAGWRRWPERYQQPRSAAVRRFARDHQDRVDFHLWLQWLLDRQLRGLAREIRVIHDVAVGVDPDGFDAWTWQHALAADVHAGAPPDAFNTQGQDWGVPPFDPQRLRADAYRPLVETIRAGLRFGGGLRIDHVLGLFRMWWVPIGASAADGAYVGYPAAEMLEILALESHRAAAVVVGEDLGTVGPGVRAELRRRNVLSSRVMWFERGRPEAYPLEAMASATTHDLPTVVGLWSGSDLEDQERLGLRPNRDGTLSVRKRLARRLGVGAGAPLETVVEEVYADLARAPSRILVAALEDGCLQAQRPNMPGTTREWPNWSVRLPRTVEQLRRDPVPRRIASVLETGRGRVR
jgi:4-alpha-glucanotransferase